MITIKVFMENGQIMTFETSFRQYADTLRQMLIDYYPVNVVIEE